MRQKEYRSGECKVMNQNEKLALIKMLQTDSGMEMSTNDLEKLLEEEMARPEAEMDVELIAELLELLEDGTAAEQAMNVEQAKQASWRQLEKKLAAKNAKNIAFVAMKWLTRAAAGFALLLALSYGMFNTAQAFNWEFLLKLFEPVAETFHLYTNNQKEPDVPAAQNADEIYNDVGTDIQTVTFSTLEEFPDEYVGYRVKPVWMPERFRFLQGTKYSDANMSKLSSYYLSDQGVCVWTVTLVADDSTVAGFEFEKTSEPTETKYVGGVLVTYYFNANNATVSASWVVDTMHYCISGLLTQEEITEIIEKMFEQERIS